MKHIVSITLTSSANNFDQDFKFLGQNIRISHFGADYQLDVMKALIQKYDGNCNVMTLSGIHPPVKIGRKIFYHRPSEKLKRLAKETIVVNGERFRSSYIPWVLRDFAKDNPDYFRKKKVGFYSGLIQRQIVSTVEEFTERTFFIDPYLHLRLPWVLKGSWSLDRYAQRMLPALRRIPLSMGVTRTGPFIQLGSPLLGAFTDCDILVANSTLLERFDWTHLKGKTLMVDVLPPGSDKALQNKGVKDILCFFPEIKIQPQETRLNFAILEGLFQCLKESDEPITEDDILNWITEMNLKPVFKTFSAPKISVQVPRKFAFVVHPLTVDDLFKHPLLKTLGRVQKPIEGFVEKALSRLPGVPYGKIEGIQSKATGETVEGLIYCIFDTPRQLLSQHPEEVYEKLVRIAQIASRNGADIIGLGAYTKIVGDAGVTVAHRSPIPVTTGNSLSASATLWAARVISERLGFLPPYVPSGPLIPAKAMVIGATGSIGAVSAKLLAKVFQEIVLVAPRSSKLLELRQEILKFEKTVKVTLAVNPNIHAATTDLIVTSTSSPEEKVLDILQVKPGCVICDVSRPMAVSEEEALKRPDVLVIESGEMLLPGENIRISCDIGLKDSAVYACLAETALLALEGRLECFTLSRNIGFQKVQQIYDMAKKHGARLAKIRGHFGEITDQEIDLCREHALRRRSELGMNVSFRPGLPGSSSAARTRSDEKFEVVEEEEIPGDLDTSLQDDPLSPNA